MGKNNQNKLYKSRHRGLITHLLNVTYQPENTSFKTSKWKHGLIICLWNIRACCFERRRPKIIKECSKRTFDIVVLTETGSETYVTEMKEWKLMNSGNGSSDKPSGELAFIVKNRKKASIQINSRHSKYNWLRNSSNSWDAVPQPRQYQQLMTVHKNMTKKKIKCHNTERLQLPNRG